LGGASAAKARYQYVVIAGFGLRDGGKWDLAIGCEESTMRACRFRDVGLGDAFAGRHSVFSASAAGGADAHVEDHGVDGADRDRGSAGN
jgi:hypothetical protein